MKQINCIRWCTRGRDDRRDHWDMTIAVAPFNFEW